MLMDQILSKSYLVLTNRVLVNSKPNTFTGSDGPNNLDSDTSSLAASFTTIAAQHAHKDQRAFFGAPFSNSLSGVISSELFEWFSSTMIVSSVSCVCRRWSLIPSTF